MSELLKIGYARKCITPEESVPLAGYGNSAARMSEKVINDLFTTCIAFADKENTVLLFSNDLLMSQESIFDPIRQAIADTLGFTIDQVLVSATHTHSGPDLRCDHPAIDRYLPMLTQQMVACAQEAVSDLKDATIAITNTTTKNMSYVRHYVLEDGTYKGVNLNVYNTTPIAYHSSEADQHMQLVKFMREGGKDVIVANWQTHPHLTGFGKADVSSDMIGVMRQQMEEALDCQFVYFSGASGNLTIRSFDEKDNIFNDHISHGTELTRYALEAAKNWTPVANGPVKLASYKATEKINLPNDELLETSKDVWNFFTTNKNYKESIFYAESKGMHSQYQANFVLVRKRLHDEGTTSKELPLYALSIGDVAFVTVPYEMFDTNGKYVRDFSPFKATIVATCANAYNSYIPSAYGYLNDCYEADVALYGPGTGERLAQRYIKMLESLR